MNEPDVVNETAKVLRTDDQDDPTSDSYEHGSPAEKDAGAIIYSEETRRNVNTRKLTGGNIDE